METVRSPTGERSIGRNRAGQPRSEGFTLLELVIVLGIIVLLASLLMPAVSAMRKMSRSTSCLANLQQWGQACQMYRNNNHGRSVAHMTTSPPNPSQRWWELLSPYLSDVRLAMLCPEATQRPSADSVDPTEGFGSAATAWWAQRGDGLGSYGANRWVSTRTQGYPSSDAPKYIRSAAQHDDRVPLLGDCCGPWSAPNSDNAVAGNLDHPGQHSGMAPFCIDRHRMAINIVFLDGHAEHVPLAQLWKLRWSETFVPRDVSVPGP